MNAPHIELDQTQIQDFLQRVQPLLSPADFALLNNLVCYHRRRMDPGMSG